MLRRFGAWCADHHNEIPLAIAGLSVFPNIFLMCWFIFEARIPGLMWFNTATMITGIIGIGFVPFALGTIVSSILTYWFNHGTFFDHPEEFDEDVA